MTTPEPSSSTVSATPSKRELLAAERLRRARRLYLIVNNEAAVERSADDQARLWGAEIAECRADPVYWVQNYGWMSDPHSDDPALRVIPAALWPEQVTYIRFLEEGLTIAHDRHVNKARSLGASWLALHLLVWHFLFDTGFLAKIGSRKEDLVDDGSLDSLFGKIRFIISRQPKAFLPAAGTMVDKVMRLVNTQQANELLGEATNSSFGRGGRRSVVLFDEFAHVDPQIANSAWVSLETVARTRWSISTPNGKGNRFHLNYVRAQPEDKLELGWRANPYRTQEWFDGLLIENGGTMTWDERAQEHDCSFSGISGYRIWKSDRDKISYTEDWMASEKSISRQVQPVVVGMDFGSGPSATVAAIILVDFGDLDSQKRPMLYIDDEVYAERQTAYDIGKSVLGKLWPYHGRLAVVGDPAGISKDSDQESWEINLRSAGLPMNCLGAWYNSEHGIQETIEDVQRMIDAKRLRIHERCGYIHETFESWAWDVPRGMTLELVSKAWIKPLKNLFSHAGDAVRYGVGFSLRGVRVGKGGAVARKEEFSKASLEAEMKPMPVSSSLLEETGILSRIAAVSGVMLNRRITPRKK